MPLMHSEVLSDLELCIEMFTKKNESAKKHYPLLGEAALSCSIKHRDLIAKYGRYPYRNEVMGRESTPEEEEYIKTAERFGQ